MMMKFPGEREREREKVVLHKQSENCKDRTKAHRIDWRENLEERKKNSKKQTI